MVAMVDMPPVHRPKHRAILLYDGECPLCRKGIGIVKRLDWLGVVDYRDARQPENLPPSKTPLIPNRLLEEMHLVVDGGEEVYHGYGAFRWMSWRLPLLVAFAPWLYVPGVPQIGQKIYLWIAKNRFKLVPCHEGVCVVPSRAA